MHMQAVFEYLPPCDKIFALYSLQEQVVVETIIPFLACGDLGGLQKKQSACQQELDAVHGQQSSLPCH